MKVLCQVLAVNCVGAALLLVGCGSSGGGGSSANVGGSTSAGATTGVTTAGSTTGAPPAATIPIVSNAASATGFAFASPVTVKSGAAVTWINRSGAPHSIVWDGQTPASAPSAGAGVGAFSAGATSSAWTAPTVTSQTSYAYHCGIHGPSMNGTVVVTP
ncbi:MAG: hypothetical protein LC772_01290 [Chloroflexi bacterium]|nr:hypothetical protein [Chloroflexota bacterium]